MTDVAQKTIEVFAGRSDRSVMCLTGAVAIIGSLLDIGAHTVSAIFMNSGGVSGLWGMWIPLCFLTIPPIHYLCRYVQNLQKRVDALEAQLQERRAA